LVGLSGDYPFEDNLTGDANTSFMSIDTVGGQICVAGQLEGFDRLALPFNRSVFLTYASNGTITKETDQKVIAEFPGTALVTLTIINDRSEALGGPVTEYVGQLTANCKLEARLERAGERDKVKLRCDDLGEDLAGFSPSLDSSLVENVSNAFGHGKRARVNTKRGQLKVLTNGDPTDSVPVSCGLGN
jgi:hypothetical protein